MGQGREGENRGGRVNVDTATKEKETIQGIQAGERKPDCQMMCFILNPRPRPQPTRYSLASLQSCSLTLDASRCLVKASLAVSGKGKMQIAGRQMRRLPRWTTLATQTIGFVVQRDAFSFGP